MQKTKRKYSNKRKTYKGGFDWSKNKTKQSKNKDDKELKENKKIKITRESRKKNKHI